MILIILGIFYYVSNPYWYGDALWYALDITNGPLKDTDAGHLIWRPLGMVVWQALRIFGLNIPILDILQLLSAFSTALGPIATYFLARRFSMAKSSALAAAALFAGSNFCLAYGGSGSAYGPATGLSALALLFAIKHENNLRDRGHLYAAILISLAILTWGLAILILPTILLAVILTRGSSTTRWLGSGASFTALVAVLVTLGCTIGYQVAIHSGFDNPLLAWANQSNHGIRTQISALSVARAILGFCASYIYLGNFGSNIKAMLTGQAEGLIISKVILPASVFFIFGSGLFLSLIGFGKQLKQGQKERRTLLILTGASLLGVAAFAIAWQGSDIERFCLTLPLSSITIIYGLGRFAFLPWIMTGLIAVSNLSLNVIPASVSHGGLQMALGRIARQTMPEDSLLVLTGQALGASVMAPTYYFYHLQVHSILFDVQTNGTNQWQERLLKMVNNSISESKPVALLSDLIGEPTSGGIELNAKENPVPTLNEVAALFKDWQRGSRWQVDRFTFIEVSPPK